MAMIAKILKRKVSRSQMEAPDSALLVVANEGNPVDMAVAMAAAINGDAGMAAKPTPERASLPLQYRYQEK